MEDGLAFLNSQTAGIVVYKNGDATIGAFIGEPFLFLNVLHDVDGLVDVGRLSVSFLEFFEDDARLVSCFVDAISCGLFFMPS